MLELIQVIIGALLGTTLRFFLLLIPISFILGIKNNIFNFFQFNSYNKSIKEMTISDLIGILFVIFAFSLDLISKR